MEAGVVVKVILRASPRGTTNGGTHYGSSAFLTSYQRIYPNCLHGRWVVVSTYTNEKIGPKRPQLHVEIERLVINEGEEKTGSNVPSLNSVPAHWAPR